MRAVPATLLQRLRLHRGVWLLVAVALLIKFATSTACLLDGPRPVFASAGDTAASMIAVSDTQDPPDETCLLGEAGGCHCACAHAVAVPASGLRVAIVLPPSGVALHVPAATPPRGPGSLLRPPIA